MKQRIGFVGLGTMGLPMAKNLLKAGYELTVYDPMAQQMELLAETYPQVRQTGSPQEVGAASDVCITMVPTPEIVRDVTAGANGLFAGMAAQSIWIDMSTSDPVVTKQLAKVAGERGIHTIDAPVARSSKEAISGQLMIMAGGEPEVYAQVESVLACMGSDIFLCGPVGSGHTMKIVNNLLGMIVLAADSEALLLGTKAGLKLETMLEVLRKTNVWNGHLQNTLPWKLFRRDFEPGYKTVLAEKDLGLAKQLARSLHVPLLCGSVVRELMTAAIAEGCGDEDFTAIIKPLERIAGVQVAE